MNTAIFIIGVSGVGKSTVGNSLSNHLSIPFFDGDDYHPKENIEKMTNGQALNDNDRYQWLVNLNKLATEQTKTNSCIIACSALKEQYRDLLKKGIAHKVKWVLLYGNFDLITERLRKRKHHFMPISLLKSQFETLEVPENALKVPVSLSVQEIVETIISQLTPISEFGLIGLGVMGKSLSRNLASKGFSLSIYNRHIDEYEENVALNFVKKHPELHQTKPFDDLAAFVNSLQKPRKIILMINAGKPVDSVLAQLTPLLAKNDIVIDGGNSHYKDTQRRINSLKKQELHFIGAGISGGEEGALKGPSIMPGGNRKAYALIQPYLEGIAAKDKNNIPCCTYIGEDGSGHFIKMVHNGIEYVEMQLLAETFHILKQAGYTPDEISDVLASWKKEANSYLLEITIEILRTKEAKGWLVDAILDVSGNKGTGNWTTIATAELGIPSTMIPAALFARYSSSFKEERQKMSALYKNDDMQITVNTRELLKAYQLARIINHHQGFKLLDEASQAYQWNLNLSEIARIWTNGCIIRSTLMEDLSGLLKNTNLILLHEHIVSQVKTLKPSLNNVVTNCIASEIPISCFSEAVNFLNTYSTANSSANIIQAQRDYFGAHMYQRVDDPKGTFYHTHWKNSDHD